MRKLHPSTLLYDHNYPALKKTFSNTTLTEELRSRAFHEKFAFYHLLPIFIDQCDRKHRETPTS